MMCSNCLNKKITKYNFKKVTKLEKLLAIYIYYMLIKKKSLLQSILHQLHFTQVLILNGVTYARVSLLLKAQFLHG